MHDGYRFLANNWESGDEIYIFGFSRGAYTARSLAGFVGFIGLLEKYEMDELPSAWRAYKSKDPVEVARLRELTTLNIPITCLGVWDTVGALGIPLDFTRSFNKRFFGFLNAELGKDVLHAFHAVAIDEKRGPFEPTLWIDPKPESDRKTRIVEQVWFPGVHSGVGGLYEDTGLSDIALDWPIKRVDAETGLEFDNSYIGSHIRCNALATGYESRGAIYAVSRIYPYQRTIGGNAVPGSFLRRFKAIDRRNLPPPGQKFTNEMLHISALERYKKDVRHQGKMQPYRPQNLKAAIIARNVPVVSGTGSPVAPADECWPEP